MIGDALLDLFIKVIVGTVVFGWIVLLLSMLLQKIMPKKEKKLELILQKIAKVCSFIMKYSAIILIGLIVVRILGEWLGWIKVDNPPVFEDYPEHPY